MFQGNIWYIDIGCRFQSANLAIEDEPFDSTCSTEDGKNEGNSSAIFLSANGQEVVSH